MTFELETGGIEQDSINWRREGRQLQVAAQGQRRGGRMCGMSADRNVLGVQNARGGVQEVGLDLKGLWLCETGGATSLLG